MEPQSYITICIVYAIGDGDDCRDLRVGLGKVDDMIDLSKC